MHKRLIASGVGLAVLLATLTISWVLLTQPAASPETQIANFEREQAKFVKQVENSSGAYIENAGPAVFDNQIVQATPPRVEPGTVSRVLGIDTISDEAEKWIDVDLSEQKLTTWLGDKKVKDYPVSTGIAGYRTVTGEFYVWRKVLTQGYRGGSKEKGTYYYLPNVPYSLFFHNGYAIHAAYWHNDFGIRPRSHGCVNMRTEDAKEVYEWANPVMPVGARALNSDETNPGTRVVIHD